MSEKQFKQKKLDLTNVENGSGVVKKIFTQGSMSGEITLLIEKVNARIPSSVTPATRIYIHPSEWIVLTDEIDRLQRDATGDMEPEADEALAAYERGGVPPKDAILFLGNHWFTVEEAEKLRDFLNEVLS